MKESECYPGKKIGRLTLISRTRVHTKNYGNRWQWHCKCDCGNEKDVLTFQFDDTHSCGCLMREISYLNGKANKKKDSEVADSNERSPWRRLHVKWSDMIKRCYVSKCGNYRLYGKRGIIVCDEWKNSFQNFKQWAIDQGYDPNNKDSKEQTIDRIDVNGNYCPENCRLISMREQCYNKRNTVRFNYDNNLVNLYQLSQILNCDLNYLRNQYSHCYKNYDKDEDFIDMVKNKLKEKRG